MPTNMPTFLKDQSGASAMVFAVVLFVVVAATALGITAGDAYSVRTKTQNALDAAVLAGAAASGGTTDAERIALAQGVYASNTSKSDEANSAVRGSATFTVSDDIVYGDVTFEMDSPFLGVFGEKSLTIRVSSAAQTRPGTPICLLGLDPTEEQTIDLNGNATVDVDECAAMANSASGNGIRQVGSSSLNAKEIGVTGGYSGNNFSPKPVTGAKPVPDPYASLPEPAIGECEPSPDFRQATVTLRPRTYCGGLDIKPHSNVKLLPGEYIMKDGPLLIQAGAVVTGDQVMIAFLGEGATMYLIGDASLTVTSPIDGPYKNIQFFGDRNVYGKKQENLWMSVIGGSRLSYDGVFYAPSHNVWWTGGAVVEAKSPSYIAVAKKLWFQGNAQVRLSQQNIRGLSVDAAAKLEYGATLVR
jgi:Flp pilus assembly protein TadG